MVIVRPFDDADYDALAAVTLRAYDASGSPIHGPYREFLADATQRARSATALLVAEHAGRPVGSVTYVLPGDEAWEGRQPAAGDCGFRVLAVDPEAQGLGAGAALVDACLDASRARGCHRMVITSMTWMTRAHGLYDRRGFVRRPDLDIRFDSGVGLVFAKDLTPAAASRFPPPGPVPPEPPWYLDVWQ